MRGTQIGLVEVKIGPCSLKSQKINKFGGGLESTEKYGVVAMAAQARGEGLGLEEEEGGLYIAQEKLAGK